MKMMKRAISMLLVLCMVLTVAPVSALAVLPSYIWDVLQESDVLSVDAVSGNPFLDVNSGDWYYNAVQYVYANGFFNGVDAVTFDPHGTMSRGMFVTVLGRMAGVDTAAYEGVSEFSDVSADQYYAPYVAWAAKHGVTTGTGGGKFSPDTLIDRQQLATFLARYFDAFGIAYGNSSSIALDPTDIDSAEVWAKDAILKLWRAGIVTGDNGKFSPADDASRAWTANVCYRADNSVMVWYKEPGVRSDRVKISTTGEVGATGSDIVLDGTASDNVGIGSDFVLDLTPEKEPEPQIDPYKGVIMNPVSFYDDEGNLIDTLYAIDNMPLGGIPSVEKSSKENAVLLGYYLDPEYTQPFYADEPVKETTKVYAKYAEIEKQEKYNFTSFARENLPTDVEYTIRWVGEGTPSEAEVKKAASIEVKDGTDPVEIKITGSGKDYVVAPVDEYTEGSVYELTLADGWIFVEDGEEMADTIRTATLSIYMAPVENLRMSTAIKYLQDNGNIDYYIGEGPFDEDDAIAELTPDALQNLLNGTGYFTFAAADDESIVSNDAEEVDNDIDTLEELMQLKEGDILCIYVGTKPTDRDANDGEQLLDPVAYVKVDADVTDDTVTFAAMGEEDQQKLYEIADNFPFLVEAIPTGNTINISQLDVPTYEIIIGETELDTQDTIDKAIPKINEGDFVTIYTSLYTGDKEDPTEEELGYIYGEITKFEDDVITYKKVSRQYVLDSMDLYADVDYSGEAVIDEQQLEEIKETIHRQVEESGFPEEAAAYLAEMVIVDNGYGGAEFEIEDLRWDADIITDKDQLRIGDGVQLSIDIDAKVNISAADGTVVIDLSASFVQEVSVDPKVKGYIVEKEIVFVPVPVGVHVGADIDVKSYTDFDFAAEVYTVSNDESAWEDIEELISDPEVDELLDQVAQLQRLIDGGIASASELRAYESEIDELWSQITDITRVTRSKWERLCEAMNRTSVASDLLEVADIAGETGISREYKDAFEALMKKYSEMLERDTDWVNLVEQDIFAKEVFVYGFAIGIDVDFVVGADMSIAIGSGLEYQVGKRYSFWFEIGLFKPTAGTSTTDLLDESFQFQFYVMGRLGVRAGVKAKLYVAVGTGNLASVGISAELGPYLKLYGFFVYENNKYRPMGSDKWTTSERMVGALFTEFGLYLILSFEAEALSLFEYSYDFMNKEFPLLYAGNRRYYYAFSYEPESGEQVVIYDEDRDSTKDGVTMDIPSSVLALSFIDLDTGRMGSESLDLSNYHFTVSNPKFKINTENGKIHVDVSGGSRFIECDLTITYLKGKMAFSNYDMSVTVPLVWTNLSNRELKEFYTAEVRVGNVWDDYDTVWSKRVLKRQPFDLPTEEEVKELIGWNDLVYDIELSPGYGNIQTEDLVIIEDLTYEFDVVYKQYAVTVTGLEGVTDEYGNPITEKTYYKKYGETFNFSDLEGSGTNDDVNGYYSKFANVTTDATVVINGEEQVIDLTKPINRTMAEALENGITAKANYIDVTTSAVFTFAGIPNTHEDVTFKICKGTTISPEQYQIIEDIVASELNMDIRTVTPNVSVPINNSTNYIVDCGNLTGERYTINFVENYSDGSVETTATPEIEKGYKEGFNFDLTNIVKLENGYIGPLYTPTRIGYTFDGWYTDQDTFEDEFLTQKMPKGGATVYAKWIPNEYEISFHVFGGKSPVGYSKVVPYDSFYGQNFEDTYVLTYKNGQVDYSLFEKTDLPKAKWTGQYRFDGWWTEPKQLPKYDDAYYNKTGLTYIDRPTGFEDFTFGDGGTQVVKDTQFKTAADTTIWAHWKELVQIPDSVVAEVFDFTFYDVPFDGKEHKANYTMDDDVTFTHNGETFTCPTDFKVMYKTNIAGGRYEEAGVNADVYLAQLTRPACDDFRAVDVAIDHVFEITKIASSIDSNPSVKSAYYANVIPNAPSSYVGDGAFEYAVTTSNSAPADDSSKWTQGIVYNVCDGNTADANTTLYLWVRLAEGRNYWQSEPAGGVAFELSDYTNGAAAKSLISNADGYSYKLTIHTPKEDNAGTDGGVFVKFGNGTETKLNQSGNDFEQGDTDTYNVTMDWSFPNAMGKIPTTIRFNHTAAQGWRLGWLRLDVYKGGDLFITGTQYDANEWYGEDKSVTYNLEGYARNVNSTAYNLTSLSDVSLTSSSSGNISASINGTLTDSTWQRTYNFYEYKNAPKLVASFNNSWFDKYIIWTDVDEFYIDKAKLYDAMNKYAIEGVTLTYGVKYSPVDGDYSVVEADRTYLQTISITAAVD